MENLTTLLQRQAVIDSYLAYAQGVDQRDWGLVRSCFADQVIIDYGEMSAATGSNQQPRAADNWVAAVAAAINGFDSTRHLLSNFRFEFTDQGIRAWAYLRADHILYRPDNGGGMPGADEIVTLVGEYNNYFEQVDGRWLIHRSALATEWITGNIDLFTAALARATG